ncbi:hypothetical protein [Niabella soli]|uniref:Membrane protein n=1 Tax=Niabella soli DSM 19437 TaxID=929713 RepID=W0F0B0_9BACT|nr:hypothetical protein [Niabella soli]AHF15253.1 membrane protein [Niabella soli DSM 19437]
MKKLVLAMAAGILSVGCIQAQSMKNTLKVGVLGGVAVPSENTAANAGIDVAYQNLVTPHVGIGIATGYNQFFGKKNTLEGTTLENNNVGLVPVAALIHYYPQAKGIYVGTDLGYGFLTGDQKVAANTDVNRPNGGFYLKPELGWHNRNWNIFANYTKVFTSGDEGAIPVGTATQKYNVGSVGIGVAYNIGLGR